MAAASPQHNGHRDGSLAEVAPRVFTFHEMVARTPTLTAAEQLRTFSALPQVLQRQAWDDLAELIEDRRQAWGSS